MFGNPSYDRWNAECFMDLILRPQPTHPGKVTVLENIREHLSAVKEVFNSRKL